MDANGTRFHLILGRDDWGRCSVDGIELRELWKTTSPPHVNIVGVSFNDERPELTLQPRLFKYVAAPKDTRPALTNRRGSGRDRYGNWYWIDETNNKIRVRSSGSRLVSDFWPLPSGCCSSNSRPGQFQPRDPRPTESPLPLAGLAVTEDHYLVAGVVKPAGTLIFDLHAGSEPRQLFWPTEVDFEPSDMAPRPGGGVWILDAEHQRYWGLDSHFNLISTEVQDLGPAAIDDFQPVEGGSSTPATRRNFPRGIDLSISSPIGPVNPIAIEALPDGTVLILTHDSDERTRFSKIYRYDLDRRIGEVSTESMLGLIELEQSNEFRLKGYDFTFVPAHTDQDGREVSDRLYVAADDGNQTYAFRLWQTSGELEWQPVSEYLPMRLFGGKGLVAAGTDVYYDFSENWIPLRAQSRPRFIEQAMLTTEHFDGVEPDCVWHRLLIDACIPPETKVEIWSRAANELFELELTAWQREPRPYLRGDGSELPFMPRRRLLDEKGQSRTADRDGTWELLFQQTRGRFLQLQIQLTGNERTTPRLRAVRAYFPRFSYLDHYLPAIYREDEQSASFLDRFLANFEGMYTSLEDKIAAVQALFDVRSAPAETLAWLAQWLGIVFEPAWDEATQRMLIRNAMKFFQYRGTIDGLKMALHLAFDACADEKIFELPSACSGRRDSIRIVEKYLTRQIPGVFFGDASELVGPRSGALTPRWQPSQGGTNLNARYIDFIRARSEAPQPDVSYPLKPPADSAELARWKEFARTTLGFVPSSAPEVELTQWQSFLRSRYTNVAGLNTKHGTSYDDWQKISLPRDWPVRADARKDWQEFLAGTQASRANTLRVLWQEFLARRYGRIRLLNQVYGTSWPAFELVSLFDVLPPDGGPLADWYQFESIAVPQSLTAHRFTVLLPVPMSLVFSPDEHQRRLDLARRMIELEKPAHTVFDVKFYWEMFRIGEARLQLDTLLGQGSRAPQLLPGLALDRGFIGSSYLAPPVPEDQNDRDILGRDPLAIDPRKERRS